MSRNYISTCDLPIQQTLSSLDPNLMLFSEDFIGLPIILVEFTYKDSNIENNYPIKMGKFFFLINSKAFDLLIQLVQK